MYAVQLEGVGRRFGEVEALAHVSLGIGYGEFFSLLGPSGCGKTTLLRIIAGLDAPDCGLVRIEGMNAHDLPAHRRPVNTVFQSYALFPHLSVWDNVAFGLRMKKVPKAEMAHRVGHVMALVEIADLAHRKPAQLSGGQKQRVALARAIVNEPRVLLLDEPLGALDLKLRQQLQLELHQLQRRLDITFLYVTHDQEEALAMSDRIGVMNAGRLEQTGPSAELYERPRTRFVAQFLGVCNLLDAGLQHRDPQGAWVQTPAGVLRVEWDPGMKRVENRARFTLAIRPERIVLGPPAREQAVNCVQACVVESRYTGAETQYLLQAGNGLLRASALNSKQGNHGYQAGEKIIVSLPAAELVVLDD